MYLLYLDFKSIKNISSDNEKLVFLYTTFPKSTQSIIHWSKTFYTIIYIPKKYFETYFINIYGKP